MKNFNAEASIIILVNKFFWKSKVGPLTMFLLPLIFMVIYFVIDPSNLAFFVQALPSFISLAILPITLITLPQMLVEIKYSIVLRRIGTSSITPLKYNLIVASLFFLICFFSTIMVILIFLCFLNTNIDKLNHINWGEFLYAIIMFYLTSIATGILLASVSKKGSTVQLVGLGFMLLTLILAGHFIPISVVGGVDAIKYISILSPINYSTSLLNNVLMLPLVPIPPPVSPNYNIIDTATQSIFQINNFSILNPTEIGNPNATEPFVLITTQWQKVLNLVMPPLIFIGFNFISYKKFSWSSR